MSEDEMWLFILLILVKKKKKKKYHTVRTFGGIVDLHRLNFHFYKSFQFDSTISKHLTEWK